MPGADAVRRQGGTTKWIGETPDCNDTGAQCGRNMLYSILKDTGKDIM